MKTSLSLFFLGLSMCAMAGSVTAPANIPDYYDRVNGKDGKNLFDAVHEVAKAGYSALSYKGLWDAYKETDLTASGKIWDMYSNCDFPVTKKCGNYSKECDCYNREHSIPKSWFGGAESQAGADLFHIVPTDGKVNGMRSNYTFGEVSNASYTYDGSQLGSPMSISIDSTLMGAARTTVSVSGASKAFEPQDEYKGDFARGYLGTMIKWANGDYQKFTQGEGATIFSDGYDQSHNFGLTRYGIALLLKWHREDPVSQKEIDRNNGIQKMQGNRNPFIDYPYLAEYIWGKRAGQKVDLAQLLPSCDPAFIPGVSDGLRPAKTDPTDYIITTTTEEDAPLKYIHDGRVQIVVEGHIYNTLGQRVE